MQINRLFEMIYILLDKKTVTASELSKHFEVSVRTIYRDVEVLSASGVPIYMTKGKGGGISLMPNYILNKTFLTENEKNDIMASLSAVKSANIANADTAINKLSSLFGNNNLDWIEVDFSTWSNSDEGNEKEIFESIKNAILKKNIITFLYANSKGENKDRRVEPIRLCYKGSNWYLFGYCLEKKDFRYFKLRRLRNLAISNESFISKTPEKPIEKENTFKQEQLHIKLKLSKEVAYRVYDEFDTYTRLDDGSFIVEIEFPKGDWIFNFLTSFGVYCKIIEPDSIKNEYISKLQKMLDNALSE